MTDKEIEVIVKTIFTKILNDDLSFCEFGIECYKKGMEYQGIKELAIENDNLIRQVRTLEAQIEEMKCDVKANIKWADKNCDNMWQKLVKMWNQWEINEK